MTDFHFLRPWWLLALPLLAILLWALYRQRRGGGDWREFCDAGLLPHILIDSPARPARNPLWLAALAGILAVLALAGPAWERLPTPVFRNLSALVVVLDLSMAMDAADLKPTRLERARFKIDDILRARKDGQTALVVYAGDAFTVTPLTDDAATIAAQLSALAPRLMPVQGTRLDLGLEMAARLLKQAGLKTGDALLVSTSEGAAGAEDTAAKLRADGYRVSALGVGTESGGPVPLAEGGFLKDSRGNIVIPKLEAAALRRLAETGGGLYREMDSGSGDLNALLGFIDHRTETAESTGSPMTIEQWREAGVFLLPLLLPLAALAFRRGWLGLWLVIALAPAPQSAEAFEWRDLWLTPDQRAQRDFAAGDAKAAAERFQDPAWKAAAEYKAGDYEQAAKASEKLDTTNGQYNRGNALANQGELAQALKAYDRALQLDPKNEDAAYNRKLVEEALRKQQEEQKKQEQKDQQQGQDQGQEPQPSQSGQDGQKSQQQNQDGQGQPQQGKDGSDSSSAQNQPDAGQSGDQKDQQPDRSNQAAPEKNQPSDKEGKYPSAKPAQPMPQQPADQGKQAEPKSAAPESESEASSETRQAQEQWLRRIPDDPGGLLKRKFYYQYRQRQQQQ
ncbi:VWA domain-containing protein [Methylomagnum sp.]